MRRLIFFLGLLVLPMAALGSNPETIHRTEHRIGILAKRGAERCLEKWNLTATYLDKTVPGHSFTIIPLDFEQITPATRTGDIDFVLANSAFYVQLEAQYGVRRLVTLKNQLAGHAYTTFGGVIFCRADRGDINRLGDLRRKTFAAVKISSFGGWHAAWRELKANDIDPERDFSDLVFPGTHDAVVDAVLAGEIDAGTVRTDTLERMSLEGLINLDDVKIIPATTEDSPAFPFLLSTRLYPEWPFAALHHTPASLAESVAAALLAMPTDDPAAVAALSQGWTVPLNYQPVHDCARELGIGFYAHRRDISLVEFMQMHWPWVVGTVVVFLSIVIIAVAFARKNQALLEVRRHLQEELVERQKTQAALENSEKRYRGLVERAADAIFILDPYGTVLEVNEAVTRLTGFTQNEVIGRHFLPAFDPIDRTQAQEAMEICLQGESVEFDSRIQRKGTESAWFSVGIQPIFDADGDVVGIQGISHDIAERKRTEHRKHQEGEAYLRTILESTADGILAVNSDDRIMHANSRFNEMWNIPAAAMSGGNSAPIYELMMAQMEDPNSLKDCVEIPAQVEKRGVLNLKDGRVFERFSCPLVF
ncbi:MAG: PhnD/SsuA/transferrin family substrate-binding protein, partial [Acidobacteriota bacterium]